MGDSQRSCYICLESIQNENQIGFICMGHPKCPTCICKECNVNVPLEWREFCTLHPKRKRPDLIPGIQWVGTIIGLFIVVYTMGELYKYQTNKKIQPCFTAFFGINLTLETRSFAAIQASEYMLRLDSIQRNYGPCYLFSHGDQFGYFTRPDRRGKYSYADIHKQYHYEEWYWVETHPYH